MKRIVTGGFAAVLALLSLGSLAVGWRNALTSSKDFQWSPARLFWEGVNPYQYFLNPDHPQLILSQTPNYGHLLYYILFPYSGLSWDAAKAAWALTNVLLFGAVVAWMGSQVQPGAWRKWLLVTAALVCIGYPVRNVIGNGQQTLLCLFALLAMWQFRENFLVSGLCLAILVTKYSFGLQIGFLMLLLGYWRVILVGGCLSLLAVLGLALQTDTPFLVALFQPLSVARSGTAIGFADLMSLGRLVSGGDAYASQPLLVASLLANLAFFGWVGWQRWQSAGHRSDGDILLLAAAVYLSLGTVYHLKYDLVFMLFGVYALLNAQALSGRGLGALVAVQFVMFWLVPGFDAKMQPNPYLEPAVVAIYAAVNLALAAWLLVRWKRVAPAAAA